MNNEISEEAKKSLANAGRRADRRRLERDGASSTAALQRRVQAIAQEKNVPPADFCQADVQAHQHSGRDGVLPKVQGKL